jgi:hypothetical protein
LRWRAMLAASASLTHTCSSATNIILHKSILLTESIKHQRHMLGIHRGKLTSQCKYCCCPPCCCQCAICPTSPAPVQHLPHCVHVKRRSPMSALKDSRLGPGVAAAAADTVVAAVVAAAAKAPAVSLLAALVQPAA